MWSAHFRNDTSNIFIQINTDLAWPSMTSLDSELQSLKYMVFTYLQSQMIDFKTYLEHKSKSYSGLTN